MRVEPLEPRLALSGFASAPDHGGAIAATAGRPFRGIIAAVAGDLWQARTGLHDVLVSWGDGTPMTSAAVAPAAGPGLAVMGSHTYALPGSYTVRVVGFSPLRGFVPVLTHATVAAPPAAPPLPPQMRPRPRHPPAS